MIPVHKRSLCVCVELSSINATIHISPACSVGVDNVPTLFAFAMHVLSWQTLDIELIHLIEISLD
jgi:hypothetical protein